MTHPKRSVIGIFLLSLFSWMALSLASSSGPPPPDWTAEGNQEQTQFGSTTAIVGDVDQDGFDDLLIGAWGFDGPHSNIGACFLFPGSSTGPGTSPYWSSYGQHAFEQFGFSRPAGDVNDDGFADVIVGARFFTDGETNEGAAFLFLGSPSGLSTSPDWMVSSNQRSAEMGRPAVTAGDVNSDGFDDVLVAARFWDGVAGDSSGAVFLFLGSPEGLSESPDWMAEGTLGSTFGSSVNPAGDVNNDGFDDIIVGAPLAYGGGIRRSGMAFVYHGSVDGPSLDPDWFVEGSQEAGILGVSVNSAGDVNGDGFDDVIVGASGEAETAGGPIVGRVHVFLGSSVGLSPQPAWVINGLQEGSGFGTILARAGDINGDGFGDFILGANSFDHGEIDEGVVFVYLGSVDGPLPVGILEPDREYSIFGSGFGGHGDVDGDGFDDIIVGAPGFDNPEENEGGAFLYLQYAPWCPDGDGDGWGYPGSVACPCGALTDPNDADPLDPTPPDEICDGLDNDCDGLVDEGFDQDGDGFTICALPVPDCDDTNPAVNPGATEIPDGVDNDCDGFVDELPVQATCEIVPSTMNLQSKGTGFSIKTTLVDIDTSTPLDPDFLQPVHISRIVSPSVGEIVLPVPSSDPGCDDFTEDGLWENVIDRSVTGSGTATLRFNVPADGHCETQDGNRQDLIALMLDIPNGETATVCYRSTHPSVPVPFECCGPVTVTNHGNR